jgi:hypothetical protein
VQENGASGSADSECDHLDCDADGSGQCECGNDDDDSLGSILQHYFSKKIFFGQIFVLV